MIVSRLSKQGKYKVTVEIDGSYAFFLYQKDLKKLMLQEGDEISYKLVEEIHQLILFPRAKNKALSLLQCRSYTKKDMEQKLMRTGYPGAIIAQVMDFLNEYHFLNDEAYVRSYIEIQGQRKSRLQMQQELQMKGISKGLFCQIWEEQPEDKEEMTLRQQLEKRIRAKGPVTSENFQKYYAFFMRKGYHSSMILSLLKEYKNV
ncbi:MAG: regulatory protein RecX [Lachnospiraceae bacterium]|nr:regulatory protein RecX [Lachnospiraceae bacterium]